MTFFQKKGFPNGSSDKSWLAMQDTQETAGLIMGREDGLDKEMVTHSSILAGKIPQRIMMGYSPRGHRVEHGWVTKHNTQKGKVILLRWKDNRLIYMVTTADNTSTHLHLQERKTGGLAIR